MKIKIDYRTIEKKKQDIKTDILGLESRSQYTFAKEYKKINHYKQISSAQANFIHSFDAYVNLYILSKFKGAIYSNHDAWAINFGYSDELLKCIKEAYTKLAKDAMPLVFSDFINIITETVGKEAGDNFIEFWHKELKII